MDFDKISTVDDLYTFLNTTIGLQVFEPEEARDRVDDRNYVSPYMF